jgi:DNA polymerase II large subunit
VATPKKIIASPEMIQYFDNIQEDVSLCYDLATKARSKKIDPQPFVEIQLAADVASRVEGLVGPLGVAQRIRELEQQMEREEVAFKIAEEIVLGRFSSKQPAGVTPSTEALADQALRAALAILTEGITAGPLEGIARVAIRSNTDGTTHLAVYYAGPIRAAGGTEAAQTVLIGDHLRNLLHLDPYSPSEQEIERYVEEKELYERRITHLQYSANTDQIRTAVRNLPIEITGEPTSEREVTGYRDLHRVETNRIRGGMVLVLVEGVIGKAQKLDSIVDRMKIPGWEWLKTLKIENGTTEVTPTKVQPEHNYIKEVIAGRPVFGYPMRPGGFRLRYGRSRHTGLAGVGIHPATMIIVDSFLAIGTHIRMERPGKGAIVTPVTSVLGPTVCLKDGTVTNVTTTEQARKLLPLVKQILFLGDVLVGVGEFIENNHNLVPSGYVEEYWTVELKKQIGKNIGKVAETLKISKKSLKQWTTDPFIKPPTLKQAWEISKATGVGLHPHYTYFWERLTPEDLTQLRKAALKTKTTKKSTFTIPVQLKPILENACIPHKVEKKRIIFSHEDAHILSKTLGLTRSSTPKVKSSDPLEILSRWAKIPIRRKAGIYIGARMGRPEKAKERKMNPPVHGLFPIGEKGGKTRNIMLAAKLESKTASISTKAIKNDTTNPEVAIRVCDKCGYISPFPTCPICDNHTTYHYICSQCNTIQPTDICANCGTNTQPFIHQPLNLDQAIQKALRVINRNAPRLVKGVKGMISSRKVPEILEKALLRSIHEVFVYKDGTIRFDSTNAPLTHFTPKEIRVSILKLKDLGYTKDYHGKSLTHENQILELKPQDVLISDSGAFYLAKVADFVDDLLEHVYKLTPYYNIKNKQDLVGHLTIGLAPHISAGIVGRIIGFTKANVGYAHPYWHAAKRRNADSDEDSICLLMDVLLNFSREYLPARRGGMMDAPLVFTSILDPSEVDDECLNLDVEDHLSLELFESAEKGAEPRSVCNIFETLGCRVGKTTQYEGLHFTHPTNSIDEGPLNTTYKELGSMEEKVQRQLAVSDKIAAVDVEDVAAKIVTSHFIPDIIGCLRTFSRQGFRCVKCNTKYRRPPLKGKCTKCEGELLLTVSEGTVRKYFTMTRELIDHYNLPDYFKQRIELLEDAVTSLFPKPNENQVGLDEFFGSSS